jgi:hypothetical protein
VIDRDAVRADALTDIMTVKPKPEHFRRLSTPKGYPYPDLSRFLDGYEAVSPVADITAGSGGRIYWPDWSAISTTCWGCIVMSPVTRRETPLLRLAGVDTVSFGQTSLASSFADSIWGFTTAIGAA